jgi:hypothetical protein
MKKRREPMPPTTDDDQRIRGGLKFLKRSDRMIIRATAILEELEQAPCPQEADDLLEVFTFRVGGKSYVGTMTLEQSKYLKKYTRNLRQFADAISRILLKMNDMVLDSLSDLKETLDVPTGTEVEGTRVGVTVPTGCCTYNTNQQRDGVSQSYCVGGLQGSWSPNPCVGQSSDKDRGSARARGAG